MGRIGEGLRHAGGGAIPRSAKGCGTPARISIFHTQHTHLNPVVGSLISRLLPVLVTLTPTGGGFWDRGGRVCARTPSSQALHPERSEPGATLAQTQTLTWCVAKQWLLDHMPDVTPPNNRTHPPNTRTHPPNNRTHPPNNRAHPPNNPHSPPDNRARPP